MKFKAALIGLCIAGAIIAFGSCGASESGTSEGKSQVSSEEAKALFKKYCVLCHGEDGKREVNGAKDLTLSEMPLDERMEVISKGKNLMTPFQGILSSEEVAALAEYTMTFR